MKIRHILPGFGILPTDMGKHGMSGIVGVAYNLAKHQVADGHEAELLGLVRDGDTAHTGRTPDGVHMVPVRACRWLKMGPYDFRYFAPAAFQLVRRGPANIHQVHDNPYLLAPGKAAVRVLQLHSAMGEVPRAYQRAVQRADAVICCSAFIRDRFLRHVDYSPEKVRVVHNGVDLGRFQPGDKQAARTGLGISVNETVVLFAGQVSEEKGLIHLVRALRYLDRTSEIRLVVAGSSTLWGSGESESHILSPYEKMVKEESSTLTVTFLGKVPHKKMPLVFQAADIFVCPSVCEEGFGLVNLEAMATGLPVVASDIGGIPEAVRDGVTGFLVPPGNPAALAGKLDLLLSREDLRAEMGHNGRRTAEGYGWETVAKSINTIYSGLIEPD